MRLCSRLITFLGLDFGIHAEMTALLVWLDLCAYLSPVEGLV